jgi:hypothetical protein
MSYQMKSVLDLSDPTATRSATTAAQAVRPAGVTSAGANALGSSVSGPTFSLKWAAGFVDGEGCIYVFRQPYKANRNLTYRLGFTITQNDRQVLEHLRTGLDIAGGGLYEVKRQPGHKRQVFTLNYSGGNALKVIAKLRPHLIRKQLEATAALAYWRLGLCGQRPGPNGWSESVLATREHFYQKLKSLK